MDAGTRVDTPGVPHETQWLDREYPTTGTVVGPATPAEQVNKMTGGGFAYEEGRDPVTVLADADIIRFGRKHGYRWYYADELTELDA